jgi:hypothetical protein
MDIEAVCVRSNRAIPRSRIFPACCIAVAFVCDARHTTELVFLLLLSALVGKTLAAARVIIAIRIPRWSLYSPLTAPRFF